MEKPLPASLLIWILLLGLSAVVAVLWHDPTLLFPDSEFGKHTIYAHEDVAIYVAVANTSAQKELGLGGRKVMATREGMLFAFDADKKWRIWSKGMNFGIDILWLDARGVVVDLREYVYPDSYPDVFEPSDPARYILEVVAGFSGANGIRVGDRIDLNF